MNESGSLDGLAERKRVKGESKRAREREGGSAQSLSYHSRHRQLVRTRVSGPGNTSGKGSGKRKPEQAQKLQDARTTSHIYIYYFYLGISIFNNVDLPRLLKFNHLSTVTSHVHCKKSTAAHMAIAQTRLCADSASCSD